MVKMIIRFESGLWGEAVLLAADCQKMRAAIESRDDTTELVRVGDCWFTETGEAAEIEAVIAVAGTDVARFCAGVRPLTMAAACSLRGD